MNLKEFLEKGYKLCEGDVIKNLNSGDITEISISNDLHTMNTPSIVDCIWEVVSAKALSKENLSEKTTWSEGEIPPVGVECEYKRHYEADNCYFKCFIIGKRNGAQTKTDEWLVFSDQYDNLHQHHIENGVYVFRPILSPEEKAEKERKEWIENALIDGKSSGWEKTIELLGNLYDKGYRKGLPNEK